MMAGMLHVVRKGELAPFGSKAGSVGRAIMRRKLRKVLPLRMI